MKRMIGWCVLGALALIGCGTDSGGSSDGGAGGGAPSATCSAFCATAHSLACPNDPGDDSDCTLRCESFRTGLPSCAAQGDAFMQCVASDPSLLICDDEGMPELGEISSDGACGAQWNDLLACWCIGRGASSQPDPQSVVDTCEQTCAKQADLACADPSCMQDCAELGPAQFAWPTIAATTECQATYTSADYECSQNGSPWFEEDVGHECIGAFQAALMCGLTALPICSAPDCQADCGDNMCANLPMSDACKTCIETKFFAHPG